MTSTGTRVRLQRFRYPHSKVGLIVPIDHGLTLGPLDGLASPQDLVPWIGHPGITGVLAHKGMIERLADRDALGQGGVMLQLNGMSSIAPQPDRKEMLTSVEAAIKLGADAVSVQVNFDGDNDAHNMALLGAVVDEAHAYGLPVLAMVYDKLPLLDANAKIKRMRHLMRIALELGCDALKLAAPDKLDDLPTLLRGMDIPVFFAGGTVVSDQALVALAQSAVLAGAAGLCLGRNVFQRQAPAKLIEELSRTLLKAEATLTEPQPKPQPALAS